MAKPRPGDVPAIDLAKAIALLVIVADHLAERFGAYAYFFNPTRGWPSFDAQIAQLLAPAGAGAAGVLGALLRDIAWLGDEGVGLFLTLSGFGLGWGIARGTGLDLRRYTLRRLGRIYPLWLTAHAAIAVPLAAVGRVKWLIVVVSALGIRCVPATFYAIVPAWWFVGLLLQLYAIVPLLWWACRRYGTLRMIGAAVLIGLALRGIGLHVAGSYVDQWSRGAIGITRLPEFAFGFGLAVLCAADPARLRAFVRDPRTLVLAGSAFIGGNVASMTLDGMIFAPLLTSFGAFVVVCAALYDVRSGVLAWLGKHSYSLYLTHQFTLMLFVSRDLLRSPLACAGAVGLALATGVGLALLLEWFTAAVERGVAQLRLQFAARAAAPAGPHDR